MNLDNTQSITVKGKAVRQIDLRGKTIWRDPSSGQRDYVQLSYIESDGASYINTGISPTNATTISVQFQIPDKKSFSDTAQQYVLGTFHRKNGTTCSRLQFVYGGNNTVISGKNYNIQYGLGQGGFDKGYGATNALALTTEQHSVTIGTSTKTITFDNSPLWSATQNTFDNPMPIYLFACNDAQDDVSRPVNYSNKLRIMSCRIRLSGELVRDLVPCYLKSTGENGMWDTVSKTFFPNSGTGTFARGEIVPEKETVLKVMTYNVGQWFNGTGVVVPSEYDEQYFTLQDGIFKNNDVDTALFCEYTSQFSEKPRTAESVLSPYLPYYVEKESGAYWGRAIYSKYPLSTFVHTNYPHDSGRFISESVIELDGKRISLIVTLLNTSSREERLIQFSTLKSYLQNKEYFILCGDFNTDVEFTEDYDEMRAASYHMANHNGIFYRTHHGTLDGSGGAPLDNIICSPNIDILNVYTDTSKFNHVVKRVDHIPLIATLRIV